MTEYPEPWDSTEFTLWHVRDGHKWYMGHNKVESFHTSGPADELRMGNITLRGYLPAAKDLFNLRTGDGIELHHTCCGRRDDPDNGELVLQLVIDSIDGPNLANLCTQARSAGTATATVDLTGIVGFGPALTEEARE